VVLKVLVVMIHTVGVLRIPLPLAPELKETRLDFLATCVADLQILCPDACTIWKERLSSNGR
jgi:hypothetical protein